MPDQLDPNIALSVQQPKPPAPFNPLATMQQLGQIREQAQKNQLQQQQLQDWQTQETQRQKAMVDAATVERLMQLPAFANAAQGDGPLRDAFVAQAQTDPATAAQLPKILTQFADWDDKRASAAAAVATARKNNADALHTTQDYLASVGAALQQHADTQGDIPPLAMALGGEEIKRGANILNMPGLIDQWQGVLGQAQQGTPFKTIVADLMARNPAVQKQQNENALAPAQQAEAAQRVADLARMSASARLGAAPDANTYAQTFAQLDPQIARQFTPPDQFDPQKTPGIVRQMGMTSAEQQSAITAAAGQTQTGRNDAANLALRTQENARAWAEFQQNYGPVDTKMFQRVTASGKPYLDLNDFQTPAQKTQAQKAAQQAGIGWVEGKEGAGLQASDDVRTTLNTILSQIEAKLPKDAAGRVLVGPDNKLSQYFQTDPELAAFSAFRPAAIQAVQALAQPGMGLRINKQEIDSAMNGIPAITDTIGTARQKVQDTLSMLDAKENGILQRDRSQPPSAASGMVKMTNPADGKAYLVPAANVAAAKAKGWQ